MSNSNNAYNGNNNSTDQIDKEQKSKVIVCVRLRPIIPDDHKNANITRSAPEICVNLRGDGQSVKVVLLSFLSRYLSPLLLKLLFYCLYNCDCHFSGSRVNPKLS